MFSLWCESLLSNNKFSTSDVTSRKRASKRLKEPIKRKMAAAKKQCFLRFLYWTESSPTIIQIRGLQTNINFALVWINISSRHFNLKFAHHFIMYWLLQNGANKNQHQKLHQRETIHDRLVFLGGLFSGDRKMWKVGPKYFFHFDMPFKCHFDMPFKCHFYIWFPQSENNYIWQESKVHFLETKYIC